MGGAEIWSTGFFLGSASADSADPAGSAEEIAGHWATFFTHGSSEFGSNYLTTQVKVASIGTNGNTILDEIDYYIYPTPPAGTNGPTPFPPQISLALTLTSDVQRGLASKGRMYLPGINASIGTTTGKIASGVVGPIADQAKVFFDALIGNLDVPGRPILASKGHRIVNSDPPAWANPVNATVTGLRLGDVYDTQRRRRNAIPESFTPRVLAA
jgi:hypothetical protein